MEYKEFSFFSDYDNLEIKGMALKPDGEIKGVVQILHGMCEYKERYFDFMKYLTGKGYVTVIHDHRGHGKSVDSDIILGYMGEGGAAALVEDAHQLTELVKSIIPVKKLKVPYILMGHSMGSMVARCYAKKYDKDIDKLIICGCPSKPVLLPFAGVIIKLFDKEGRRREHSRILDFLMIESPYERRFKSEKLRNAWINSDRELVEKYNADPLCNYTFTINGYVELARLTSETYSKKDWAMENKDMPIFFVSGKDDPCNLGPRNFGKAVHFMKQRGYTDVHARLYSGMRHEILNEKKGKRVYLDIYNFISESE